MSKIISNLKITISVFCVFLVNTGVVYAALDNIPEVVKSEVPAPEIDARSWVLANFETGWVLAKKDASLKIEPASLTKLMTSFLVFNALNNNEISVEDMVYVSEKAWKTIGSKMFIQVDTKVSVLDLIQGLIVQSGNDAAVALAEHLGGTEEGFVARMNLMAAELGMTNSNFTNSSGLPNENHYSTALDMTILSISMIRRFPEYYRFYSQNEFTYNDITQQNRNILLKRDPTVDGIKTGHTKKAGYCLIGTANRNDIRFIATVTGSESKTSRADQVQSLLQFGYGAYDGIVAYEPGTEIKSLPLWMGNVSSASIGITRKLGIIFPKGKRDKLSAELELPESLEAPIDQGTAIGQIHIKFDGQPFYKSSLYVNEDYPEGSWYSKILDSVKRLIF